MSNRKLTRREIEVLWCIAQGLKKPEIASLLGIKQNTVRTYVQSILTTLKVHTQAEAVRIFVERSMSMAAPEGEDIENIPREGVAKWPDQDVKYPAQPMVNPAERVRVIRVIELSGTREWMLQTLSASLVSKGHDFRAFNGRVRELAREELTE